MTGSYPRVSTFKTPQDFRARLSELGLELPCDDRVLPAPLSPLAAPLEWNGLEIGNRWAIHPMEGWDGTLEGAPSECTFRRWRNFGLSGAGCTGQGNHVLDNFLSLHIWLMHPRQPRIRADCTESVQS